MTPMGSQAITLHERFEGNSSSTPQIECGNHVTFRPTSLPGPVRMRKWYGHAESRLT